MFYKKVGVKLFAYTWSLLHLISGILMYFIGQPKYKKLALLELARVYIALVYILILSYAFKHFITRFEIFSRGDNMSSLLLLCIVGSSSLILMITALYIFNFQEKKKIGHLIKLFLK